MYLFPSFIVEHTIKVWFHKKTSDQSQYTVVCRSLLRKDSISSSTILEQEASWLFVKREWKQANLHPHQRHVWSQSRLRNSPKTCLVLQQPVHCKQVQPRNANFSLTQTIQCSHSKQRSVGMILTDYLFTWSPRQAQWCTLRKLEAEVSQGHPVSKRNNMYAFLE